MPSKILRSILKQAPLLGEEVAERARRYGVTVHHTEATPRIPLISSLLEKLKAPNVYQQGHREGTQKLNRLKSVNLDYAGVSGMDKPRMNRFVGLPTAEVEDIANNKLYEATTLAGLLPKTQMLKDVMRSTNLRRNDTGGILESLRNQLPGGFVIKPQDGYATSAATLVTDRSAPEDLSRLFSKGVTNNQGARFSGRPGNLLVQERIDAQPLGRLARIANNVTEMVQQKKIKGVGDLLKRDNLRALVGGPMRGAQGSMSGGASKEFRLHVVDGKVVPYATADRGSVLGGVPWRSADHSRAEKSIQQQINAMGADKLKGTWGFDVIKTRDGGFQTVETNPTSYVGGSGIASFPHIQDALAAAIEGRIPRYVLAQRGLQTAGMIGAAGVGAAVAQ